MTSLFIEAKRDLRENQRRTQNAERARERFENRQKRLNRQNSERGQELREQVDTLAESPEQVINAIMDRVKSKPGE